MKDPKRDPILENYPYGSVLYEPGSGRRCLGSLHHNLQPATMDDRGLND